MHESVYNFAYDSMHDLHTSQIWIQFFYWNPLQWFVYTFQQKKSLHSMAATFSSKSYTVSYAALNAKSHV
jgi:hypothetical protein